MTAVLTDEILVRYRSQTAEALRAPMLQGMLIFTMLVAWLIGALFPLSTDHRGLVLCLVALALGLASLWLLRGSYAASAGLFLFGLAAVGLATAWLFPGTPTAFFLGLIVAAGVFLFDVGVGLVLAAILTSGLLYLAWGIDVALPPGAMAGGVSLIWLNLILTWLGTQPTNTLAFWSWHHFVQARQRTAQMEEYQIQLSRTLKSLDEAYRLLKETNRRLSASKAVAEEARRAKAEFVANVSHELRTPINMITGFTEMILRAPRAYAPNGLPPALLADLDVVLRNAQHLADLINDILDLSQLDMGRLGLVREWASLEEIAWAAVASIEPLARLRGLPMEVTVESNLPPLFIDTTRIRQVLLNLMSNAVRFTESGQIRLAVHRRGNFVVVTVSDTGPGIAEADIPKLFEPFRQLDGSTRRRYSGTGLGLHISRSFIALHNGEMSVESQVGEGTTIRFNLPTEDPVPLSRLVDHDGSRPAVLAPSSARYIVVEPHPVLEKLLQRYGEGTSVVPAASIEKAAALSRKQPAQAVVFRANNDCEMQRLMEEAAQAAFDVPLITCTMPGALEAYAEALQLAGYLLKPIRRQQLLDILSRWAGVRTVLIVDDDRDFLRLFARMLRTARRKYTVWQAMDAEEALALLERAHPDAIFLDVMLPDLDGLKLLDRIRSQTAMNDIPIFFITARDASGRPLVANYLGITHRGGLSTDELMRCIQAVGQAFNNAIPPLDRGQPATDSG